MKSTELVMKLLKRISTDVELYMLYFIIIDLIGIYKSLPWNPLDFS